jgi:hypothetical protein
VNTSCRTPLGGGANLASLCLRRKVVNRVTSRYYKYNLVPCKSQSNAPQRKCYRIDLAGPLDTRKEGQRRQHASEPRHRGVVRCIPNNVFVRTVFTREGLVDDNHWLTIRIVCSGEVSTGSQDAIAAPKNRTTDVRLSTLRGAPSRLQKLAQQKLAHLTSAPKGSENSLACCPLRPENSGLLDLNTSLKINSDGRFLSMTLRLPSIFLAVGKCSRW